MIWFGYGTRTVVASAFVVSIFPVIANTLSGILSTEPALRDLFRLYGASTFVTLWKLRFPAALPQILTGLRVASGLAVIGAIVGEFIGGQGLGSVVDVARTQQRVDKVFAAVLLASVLGLSALRTDQLGELCYAATMARVGTMNRRQFVFAGSAALLAACGKAPGKIRLALNWKPDPQFGGFYAAPYQAHGLDVEILPGGAGTPTIQMVGAGSAEFGVVSADELVVARSQGNDVVALFAVFQRIRKASWCTPRAS